ncbi:MAG TPA: hypothetical protein VHF23_06190 [Gaiellaceae bacterium]|nr:hypothetical protein [Gaiellaceae bacterium]
MTDHVARLYAAAIAIVAFFVTWAVVAARPWAEPAAPSDRRLVALERREERLRRESIRVQRVVERRFAAYRVRLAERQQQIAAAQAATATPAPSVSAAPAAPAPAAPAPAPSVGVVSVPPVTSTRSS